MVRSIIMVLSGALYATVAARADLLLSPMVLEREGEGGRYKELGFSDGNKTVTYQPPQGWEYSGSAMRLTLRPPNKAQAEATIIRVPLPQPVKFDDESLQALVDDMVATLPKGSESISVISQQKCPLMIQRKETFLLVLAYTVYGQKYMRSILFLNRGSELLRLQLTSHEADFKELQAAFLRSQYTWQQL